MTYIKNASVQTAVAGNLRQNRPENQTSTATQLLQRVIRISELASTPATPHKPAKQGKLPVSPATVWRWVREGKFPKPFKLGESVTVWDLAVVEAFIERRAGSGAK